MLARGLEVGYLLPHDGDGQLNAEWLEELVRPCISSNDDLASVIDALRRFNRHASAGMGHHSLDACVLHENGAVEASPELERHDSLCGVNNARIRQG